MCTLHTHNSNLLQNSQSLIIFFFEVNQTPHSLGRFEMAVACMWDDVGEAKQKLSDLTPSCGLITAQLPAFKGSLGGYRVSAVMAISMSCLFVNAAV